MDCPGLAARGEGKVWPSESPLGKRIQCYSGLKRFQPPGRVKDSSCWERPFKPACWLEGGKMGDDENQEGKSNKPRAAVTQAGFVLTNMVAGAGFEPTTFGL
ncbi:hypothetical protein D3C80_1073700 [compost metagenome]